MKTDILNVDPREFTRAPVWLKFLLSATLGIGLVLCLAGFVLLSGQG